MIKSNPAEHKQLEVCRNIMAREDVNEVRTDARQQKNA